MTNNIRNNIMLELKTNFTTEQLQMIDLAVAKSIKGYKIEKEETLPIVREQIIPIEVNEFLIRKQIKGCSDKTLEQYKYLMKDFSLWLNKDIRKVTDIDILSYLDYRLKNKKVSKKTLDNNRLILSSFYSFMRDTGKISYNPMSTIDRIKFRENVREPLSDIELEKVRNACKTLREKAMFEVFYSTGARVSEIVELNYTDINFINRSVLITGKGDQERHIYFNAKSIIAIQNYMETRNDDNNALFVSYRKPYKRLSKTMIEKEIKNIGERSGIGRNIFPHLLRHTFATDMLEHGANIDIVSKLLGHKKLETTQIYAKIKKKELEFSHNKYIT